MAVLTIAQIKAKFGSGAAPRSADYVNLIETLADDRNAVYFDSVEPEDTDANPLWFNTANNELSVYSNSQWNAIQGGSGTEVSAALPLSYNSQTGEISIDLSSYDTSSEVDGKLSGYATEAYADQSELDAVATANAYTDAEIAAIPAPDYTGLATETYADTAATTAAAAIVDSSPATLDTLNELAAALGDDPNFATTVTNQIAGKADSSHSHSVSDVTNLQTSLDSKASTGKAIAMAIVFG